MGAQTSIVAVSDFRRRGEEAIELECRVIDISEGRVVIEVASDMLDRNVAHLRSGLTAGRRDIAVLVNAVVVRQADLPGGEADKDDLEKLLEVVEDVIASALVLTSSHSRHADFRLGVVDENRSLGGGFVVHVKDSLRVVHTRVDLLHELDRRPRISGESPKYLAGSFAKSNTETPPVV